MSEPPRGDHPEKPDHPEEPPGSAPWERPRRWNQQRLDATRVDDLLARLGNDEEGGGRRHRRRGTGNPDDAAAATPASELIAALQQPAAESDPTADQEPAHQEQPDQELASQQPPDRAPAGQEPGGQEPPAGAAEIDRPGAGEAGEQPADQPDAEAASEPSTDQPDDQPDAPAPAPGPPPPPDEPTDHPRFGGPGKVTMPGYDDNQTDQLPKLGPFEDVASIRESLRRQHAGDQQSAGGIPTGDAGNVAAAAGGTASPPEDASDASQRSAGQSAGRPPPQQASPSRQRRHYRRNQGFLWTGRAAIAVVSAVILVFAGMRWNLIQQTNEALQDHQGSYIQPSDTNISTPTKKRTSRPAAGGGAPAEPAEVYDAENILLIGSDTRAGDNGNETNSDGNELTAQSDTLMIAHISADRQNVTIVSVPRDLQVPAPTCKEMDYGTGKVSDHVYEVSPTETWKITNAFAVGGPACTVLAVQKLTGLRIHRVIGIDFNGFKTMVDALGGVQVNICKRIYDNELGLIVAKGGEQTIQGTQALNLVRARKVADDGFGNDYGRIRRQQVVLSAMLRQVTSAGVLLSTDKLEDFLHAFTEATFTDNVTVDSLLNLAHELGDLSPGKVTFYTLPAHGNPADGGETQLLDPIADAVFAALVNDERLPGEHQAPPTSGSTPKSTPGSNSTAAGNGSGSSSAGNTTGSSSRTSRPGTGTSQSQAATSQAPQTLSVDPSVIDVQVVNVTGRAWVATETMNTLNDYGFDISESDLLRPEGDVRDGITVEYSAGNRDAAVTLATAVPGSTLVRTDGLGEQLRLLLGSSFDGELSPITVGDEVPDRLRTTPAGSTTGTGTGTGTGTEQGAGESTDNMTESAPQDGAPGAENPPTGSDELAGAGQPTPTTHRTSSTVTLHSSDLPSVNASEATCA